MTRSHVFSLLITTTLISTGLFLFWAVELALASKPISAPPQVLGASSTSQTNAPGETIGQYPLPAETKPFINARRYVLYHVESGKVVAESNGTTSVPVASTTKLMTALTFLEVESELTATTEISRYAATQIGSTMGLLRDEVITFNDLLYGLLLNSGNDAAAALAEHAGGKLLNKPGASSEEKIARFVQEMNMTAARLKLGATSFKDPAGLDDAGRSSAFDLAKLTAVTNENEVIRSITSTAQYQAKSTDGRILHDLRNSNRLVADYLYSGASTGKTGFTPDAGHCLVGSATRDGVTLIAVILSTYVETKEASAIETRKLLDWGFSSLRFE